MNALREALRALRGFEALAAGVAATAAVLALSEGGIVALLAPLLTSFQAGGPDALGRLRVLALVIGILVVLRAGLGYASQMLSVRLELGVMLGLRKAVVEALYRRRFEEIRALGDGHLVNLYSSQIDRIVSAVGALGSLLTAGLLLGVYGITAVRLSWPLALAAGALGIIGFLGARVVSRRVAAHSVTMTQADEEATRLFLDDVTGLATIRAYDAGAARLVRHAGANQRLLRASLGLNQWRNALGPATEAAYALAAAGGLLAVLALSGSSMLGGLPVVVTFGVILRRLQSQLASVSEAWTALAEQEGAALNVHVLVGGPDEPSPHSSVEPGPIRAVEVSGVEFGYRPGEPVLAGVDLDLKRGEITALVGASGSGKSTLVHLLARLRTPAAGRVLLDGIPLDDLPRAALAARVGVVFDDAFVFDESVLWNVTLGRPLDQRSVAAAMRLTGITGLGGTERAGPRGRGLSGGQRQRLALARALAGEPDVLLLDEATSALDAASERSILEPLRELRRDAVTLVVAHRLSTVLVADRIAVLDGGRIVATGTHDELLAASEAYRRLVETQLVQTNAEVEMRSSE